MYYCCWLLCVACLLYYRACGSFRICLFATIIVATRHSALLVCHHRCTREAVIDLLVRCWYVVVSVREFHLLAPYQLHQPPPPITPRTM
jgi:hypothetical protein